MMTLRQLSDPLTSIPAAAAWLVGDLGIALGKQELFTRQSPQRLKALREHALIESAVSSNRIEGVEVDPNRVATLVFGHPPPRDRDEQELRGYRAALELIHRQGRSLLITEANILTMHKLARGEIWDAGKYKERTEPIIERSSGGGSRIRFMPVAAGRATEAAMAELVDRAEQLLRDRRANPFVVMGAFALDFLCIHPFRDGNGRVSRLLMLLLTYHAGAEVGRYISFERLIEQSKQRYYETLEQSSADWHQGRHNPWPFINYVLWVLKDAYRELEQGIERTAEPPGAKAQLIRDFIARQVGPFRLIDVERACPGVGRDWIQDVLRAMRKAGQLRTTGRGAGARWEQVRNEGTALK